ncbi:MAG: nucleotide exchange factor GrpE [Nitrospiraceae bacterium]|nr:nucleotide exchange factor GrpE [Nitrospiraceae bacterium]
MTEENIFEEGQETGAGKEGLLEEKSPEETIASLEKQTEEEKVKYLRLYAEFDNYKKMAAREKEELSRRAGEEIIKELLPTLDNLETALKHATDASGGLAQGVEMTLRELKRVLEKHGLEAIDALGQPFNPEVHHAISQIERDDVPDKTVVEEFRAGYKHNGKVLRASLVAVSRKTKN